MATPIARPYDTMTTTSRYLGKVKQFWQRRLDIQQSHVNALSTLLSDSDIPTFSGSLGAAMVCAKKLLREEVEYQEYTVQRLRSAYEVVEALYPTENNVAVYQCPLIQQARALELQEEELTKQKRELTRLEAEADMSAIVSYHTISPPPCPESPTSPRFGLSRLFRRRSYTSYDTSTDHFHCADMKYRDSCIKYNTRRQVLFDKAERAVEVSVQFNYDFLEAIKDLITAFANTRADFAQFLNAAAVQLTSMDISAYEDSDRFRVELRNGISTQIGLPYQYKNFEFIGWRAPIILFGCPIASEPLRDDCPAACAVHAFHLLAAHTHALGTPPRNDESETILRKVAHDLETHWDPAYRNGGPAITSMLINPGIEASSGDLLIHFLRQLPEPLIPMQELDKHANLWEPDPWVGKNLTRLTSACNRPWVGSCRRRMLVTLGRLLASINNSSPKAWWAWWNTDGRALYWSELLTRRGGAVAHLLPWWLFSITLRGSSIEIEDVKVNALRLI